jgi:hypothetical protein
VKSRNRAAEEIKGHKDVGDVPKRSSVEETAGLKVPRTSCLDKSIIMGCFGSEV